MKCLEKWSFLVIPFLFFVVGPVLSLIHERPQKFTFTVQHGAFQDESNVFVSEKLQHVRLNVAPGAKYLREKNGKVIAQIRMMPIRYNPTGIMHERPATPEEAWLYRNYL